MKKLIYILLLIFVAFPAIAQRSYNIWSYSLGFGAGDLNEYIGTTSFRGVAYNYSKLITDNVGVGLEIAWNTFYEKKDFDTYSHGKFDYSGKQWRYSNHIPLLFNLKYYFTPDDDLVPFVGMGVGTIYAERKIDMGQWAFTRAAWEFALKPEIGVIYDTGATSVSLSGKYFYGFMAGNFPAQSYFTINIGLAFIN